MTPDCIRVLDALPNGALPSSLAAHAAGCSRCRTLVSAAGALTELPRPVLSETGRLQGLEKARAAIAAEPKVRPWWRAPLVVLQLGLICAAAFLFVGQGQRGAFRNAAPVEVVLGLSFCIFFGVMGLASFAAFAPQARKAMRAALVFAGFVGLGVAVLGTGEVAGHTHFWKAGGVCTALGLGVGLVPFATALIGMRHFAFRPLSAFVAGLGSLGAGLFALNIFCDVGAVSHLSLFHVLPWVAMAGVGVFIRSRMRTLSFAP